MIQQLRIYQINPALREDFHKRFKNHTMPIMQSHGLHIVSMWESETDGKLEFIYIIEAENEEVLLSNLGNFLADPEWIAIKEHTAKTLGDMVIGKQERILKIVNYSTDN